MVIKDSEFTKVLNNGNVTISLPDGSSPPFTTNLKGSQFSVEAHNPN